MQINPNRLKSSRDHTETQLNRQIATKFIQTRLDPLIDHRITILNTQAARFRQLHKQFQIT